MNPEDSVSNRLEAFIDESKRLVASAPAEVLGYIALLAGVATWVDLQLWDYGGELLVGVIGLVAGYYLMTNMLIKSGLVTDGMRGSFGAYFGVGIVVGIGTTIGLLLLIIPGLLLIVRWMPAYGYVLADGESVSDALGKSWDVTGDHFWPIAIIAGALVTIALSPVAVAAFAFADYETFSVPVMVGINVLTYLSAALSTAVGLAVYSLLAYPDREVSDVFE
ncbi:hypothetical protein QWY75_05435 [Pontixanthobacter aestiaquae]|uniref:DUF4013 domain-containing protein n=1 Tax=Pontixanthobacter aestiaquae TaxID=1509367 RepID=A0A844Z606_9SPHN|nr:hypothetical protein [Pontixanthobacter aestiaquae]MDN3645648.1 hypothetical protein [Pontixanthobacter aestiaquae]MXO83355.1 hypothetical protein [Pontixanthobacter aestiaquae]